MYIDNHQWRNRATWLEINTKALTGNIRAIRGLLRSKTQLMAVVKANAYGHGAPLVAEIVQKAGADRLAVATVGEGIELRREGIRLPILVLGHTPATGINDALCHDLTLTIHNQDLVAPLSEIANSQAKPAKVHVKVNTGMNRLGLKPTDVASLLWSLREIAPTLQVEGIFTHFATADQTDQSFIEQQFSHFQKLLRELATADLHPPIAHAANSAATVRFPATHLDMVRCGIALYGLHPDAERCRLMPAFQPVLRWKAQIVQLTPLRPGDTISYGRTFRAEHPMVVATIPVGYADGFPRTPYQWGSVLIHGEEAPIVGRVCMDQTVVDVTALLARGLPVRLGDEVVLIGTQQQKSLTAEMIGQRIGTINYEVVSQILPRVPRMMV